MLYNITIHIWKGNVKGSKNDWSYQVLDSTSKWLDIYSKENTYILEIINDPLKDSIHILDHCYIEIFYDDNMVCQSMLKQHWYSFQWNLTR